MALPTELEDWATAPVKAVDARVKRTRTEETYMVARDGRGVVVGKGGVGKGAYIRGCIVGWGTQVVVRDKDDILVVQSAQS